MARISRLRAKTNANNAPAYTLRPLLKKGDYRIKAAKLKAINRLHKASLKAIRIQSIKLLVQQPQEFHSDSIPIWNGECETPHPSHYIFALNGHATTIYCKQCGLWSKRAKLRMLAAPCHGVKNGNSSQLRLLQCGVQTGPNARIPAHLKRHRGRRKTRL